MILRKKNRLPAAWQPIGCSGMKHKSAPVARRPVLTDIVFAPEFVRKAYTLVIRRAARNAHRIKCDRDVAECSICRDHARAIADAKWKFNHVTDSCVI